jgi:two-component system cell cycle sensor histidine kinase/response regulator CckA
MQNILRPLVGKAIELNIELADGLERIEADKTQIEQVVLNLVVNARDAVGENGAIKLRTLDLSGSETDSNGRVVLEVIDNGSGIRPEIAKRIFEPFFTTKGMDKGTGLGLSTVRNIVEKHGGTIQVDSQPGKGSCFRVEFPASNRTVLLEKN